MDNVFHISAISRTFARTSYTLIQEHYPLPILLHEPFKLEEDFILYSTAARLKHDLYQLL